MKLSRSLFLVLLSFLCIASAQADVVLPDGTTTVESQAFTSDTSLTGTLVVPASTTEIGAEAFSGCTGLTALKLPSTTAITIGSKAFAGCTSLSGKLYLHEDSVVAEDAFADTDVTVVIGTPEGYPEIVSAMIQPEPTTITIYDYWSGSASSSDYQDWIEATYNVKIQQMKGGDWGTCASVMTSFVNAPDGSLRAYIIEPSKVAEVVTSSAAAPWSNTLFSSLRNQAVVDLYTINSNSYAVSYGCSEPRQLIFFNKRILEEAGIDWSSIYDMQAAGTWTWSAFESMLSKAQRDTDNDSVIDVWGLTGSDTDLYQMAVFSNGASFFDYDASGNLQPTMNSSSALAALNWSRSIWSEYSYPQSSDSSWDYYKTAWKEGNAAFYMYQAYGGFNTYSEMAGMADAWGAVAFPQGSSGSTYLTTAYENATLIPNVYDAETSKMISFFVDLYNLDVSGNSSSWVGNKLSLTDSRAVYETYGMLRKPEHAICDKTALLGPVSDVLGVTLLWNLQDSTPAELIDSSMSYWQGLCDTFNAK